MARLIEPISLPVNPAEYNPNLAAYSGAVIAETTEEVRALLSVRRAVVAGSGR